MGIEIDRNTMQHKKTLKKQHFDQKIFVTQQCVPLSHSKDDATIDWTQKGYSTQPCCPCDDMDSLEHVMKSYNT